MTELTLGFVDAATGAVILDDELAIAAEIQHDLLPLLGTSTVMGCAKPIEKFMPTECEYCEHDSFQGARIAGVWHNSLVEGPGRRSVVQFQGCPIRCQGCWVPETWDANAGEWRSTHAIARALLDSDYSRDGVTILGGEPFAQPEALARLVDMLRLIDPDLHITVYSGYTLQALIRRTSTAVSYVLASIDVLIDGAYVEAKQDSAGPWTGSGNQRVHTLR